MSYVFRLHNTGNPQLKNWEASSLIRETDVASIIDTLQQSNDAKLGSSIPSPLARMYLFETAFKIVSEGRLDDTSVYHQLVSDCLDLYQLLYMHAGEEEISFQKWDKRERLDYLKNSVLKEHRQLAEALEIFFDSRGFKEINDLYLIYYNNRLVGGTSPLTGLYVSPNWRRIKDENGWVFTTQIGDYLFDSIPFALHQRDEDFQIYMHRFINAYKHDIVQVSESFHKYFFRSGQESEQLLLQFEIDRYTEKQYLKDYELIDVGDNDSNNHLRAGKWVILKPREDDDKIISLIKSKSDFLMEPTENFYNSKSIDGRQILVHTPLVLVEGNHNLTYVESAWKANLQVDDIPFIPLEERKLPGTNIKYPYLTTGDFLESDLVKLPFNIDTYNFFTGYNGNFPFLLPIKKEYFNFFTFADLQKQLVIEKNQARNTLEVTLNIPLKYGRNMPLKKTYDISPDSDQVVAMLGNTGANIGIYPFLRVLGDDAINSYMVMLATNMEELSLHFYRFGDISQDKEVDVRIFRRSELVNDNLDTFYVSIEKQVFDCIELVIGESIEVKGLIIPRFKEVQIDRLLKSYSFAVDFGTTNTHVAYVDSLAIQRREKSPVLSFDIMEKDRQMVLLSEIDHSKNISWDKRIANGAKNFGFAMASFDREFFLSFIGESMPYEFPIRTTICEYFASHSYEEAPLFTRSNIGFFFEKDSGRTNNLYNSNIKWAIEDNRIGKSKQRVEVFIRELLWMIKNKLLFNHGNLSPTIIWMVPLSMSKRLISLYTQIWEQEIEQIFGPNHTVNLVRKYESIVPYYALQGIRRNMDVLNIDIGGGTTDVLFFYRSRKVYYSTSFKFAGNDIWGDGLEENVAQEDNGFLSMMDKCIDKEESLIINRDSLSLYVYRKQKDTLGSADVCSLLFKYDELFRFSEKIRRHHPLQTILIIHLSAIIFHLSQIIKSKKLNIPQYISFSGRGSKYLFLITPSKEFLEELILKLFEVFTKQSVGHNSRLFLSPNPKIITAEGALKQEQFEEREQIDRLVSSIVHLGINHEPFRPNFTVSQIQEIEQDTYFQFDQFVNGLQHPDLQKLFKDFELSFRFGELDVLQRLKDLAKRSYTEMIQRLEETHNDDLNAVLEETPFFWYLKDALYHLSKELETKANIRCGEDDR